MPMHLKVRRVRPKTAIRLATLPPQHPLHKPIRNAKRRMVRRHKSLLHHLPCCMNVDPDKVETVPVVRTYPAEKQEDLGGGGLVRMTASSLVPDGIVWVSDGNGDAKQHGQ
jgi:hypothetical protein